MKKYITTLSLAAMLASSLVAAQATKADIMSLMEKTGSVSLSKQMVNQMFSMYSQQAKSKEAKEALEKVKAKMNVEDLIDRLIPVYQKYYTSEDIKNLNKFYDTPTGKKLIKTMPDVARDSMNISQKWAMEIDEAIKAEAK